MVTEIEKGGVRSAWLSSTPAEAKVYLDALSQEDKERLGADKETAGYLEGLTMLSTLKEPPKLVIKGQIEDEADRPPKDAAPSRTQVTTAGHVVKLPRKTKLVVKAALPQVSEETLDDATDEESEEHSLPKKVGRKIAIDHLSKDPRYYVKMKRAGVEKAILTKPSEKREKPTKKAKPPTKAKEKVGNKKSGKARYKYDAKPGAAGASRDKTTGAPGKGKAVPPTAAETPAPEPAPAIDVQGLASALQVPLGTLKRYAAGFSTATSFVSYVAAKMRPFLAKHNIGPDKLRRLYEALRTAQ